MPETKTRDYTLGGVEGKDGAGSIEPVCVTASSPPLTKVIDAVAERDLRQSVFSTTELGRRYWERLQAKEPIDMPTLQAEAGHEERKSLTRLLSWGVEETMECVASIRGTGVPDLKGEAAALWLLRNRKDVLTSLRDRLFTDESGNGTPAQ